MSVGLKTYPLTWGYKIVSRNNSRKYGAVLYLDFREK